MILTDKAAYLKSLAEKNKAIAHNDATHQAFITIEEEEALGAAISKGLHFPCLVMVDATGRLSDKGGRIRTVWQNSVYFLARVNTHATELQNKQAAYEAAETIMREFISFFYNEIEEEGSCGPFADIDLNTFRWRKTGKVSDNAYGFALTFSDEYKATDITNFDESKWND